MKLYITPKKVIFTLFAICLLYSNATNLYAQTTNPWDIYYQTPPNSVSCIAGKLSQQSITNILQMENFIRNLHGLNPVTYQTSDDNLTAQAALLIVANATLNHTPPSSYTCYTADGYTGSSKSNLFSWSFGNANQAPISEEAMRSWLMDTGTDSLGHRRALINPFLSHISFGRCDGYFNNNPAQNYLTGGALKVFNSDFANLSGWANDFVAYPYQDYPINLFEKAFWLSFSAFPNKTDHFQNDNRSVDFSGGQITMNDESGNPVQLLAQEYDYVGWGDVFNVLRWKVNGLQDHTKYNVTIKGVKLNGVAKEYNYWFNLNYKTLPAPNDPSLDLPLDKDTLKGILQWKQAPVQYPWSVQLWYKLRVSKNPGCAAPYVIEENQITDAFYTNLNGLENNTVYYWQVATENEGGQSDWTKPWSFRTSISAPAVPILSSPLSGANTNMTPTLVWNSDPNASSYYLQVSNDRDIFEVPNLIVDEPNLKTASYTFPANNMLTKNIFHYWKVKAKNSAGESEWSQLGRFRPQSTSVEDEISYKAQSVQVYPNPLSDKAQFIINLPRQDKITLKIYNSIGVEVATLLKDVVVAQGYTIDYQPGLLPNGLYFYRLKGSNSEEVGAVQISR